MITFTIKFLLEITPELKGFNTLPFVQFKFNALSFNVDNSTHESRKF
jgi:hypothetical protein